MIVPHNVTIRRTPRPLLFVCLTSAMLREWEQPLVRGAVGVPVSGPWWSWAGFGGGVLRFLSCSGSSLRRMGRSGSLLCCQFLWCVFVSFPLHPELSPATVQALLLCCPPRLAVDMFRGLRVSHRLSSTGPYFRVYEILALILTFHISMFRMTVNFRFRCRQGPGRCNLLWQHGWQRGGGNTTGGDQP